MLSSMFEVIHQLDILKMPTNGTPPLFTPANYQSYYIQFLETLRGVQEADPMFSDFCQLIMDQGCSRVAGGDY
jgi:hypothetical protein